MQEALKTGKPTISNVFYGAFINRYFITAGIPVNRGGRIAYYLLVAIPADTFSDALKNAGLPGQWIVALIDRANTIIARSERHGEYAGTKVNFDFTRKMKKTEGVNIGPTRYRRRLPLELAAVRLDRLDRGRGHADRACFARRKTPPCSITPRRAASCSWFRSP